MSEFGSVLRKFSPAWDGRLEWQLLGLDFVDMADVDPATDGRDIYSKQEHQVMDYSKPSGKDWKWYGYSLDSVKYPEDARLFLPRQDHQLAIPFIRYLDGRRYAYMTGMNAAQFVIEPFTAKIHVYDKDSAEEIRQISPGPEVGRTSGWIDIPYGVRAFRRSDGRYLVNAEDAAHGKVILYMWKPGAY